MMTQPSPTPSYKEPTQTVADWLSQHGVAYRPYRNIPVAHFDEKKSQANQARPVAINGETVDRYVQSMRRAGEYRFPPIVAYSIGSPENRRLVIIDGNHRLMGAKKAGLEAVSGYIVAEDTPSATIALLTVNANAGHGDVPDQTWRIKQAVALMDQGFTEDQAAEAAAVTTHAISTYQAVLRAHERSRKLGLTAFPDLPATTKVALSRLRDDPVFVQASRVVMATAMNATDTDRFCREIQRMKSEQERITLIGTVAEERKMQAQHQKAMGRKRPAKQSANASLASAIGKLMAVDVAQVGRELKTDLEIASVARLLNQAAERILDLQVTLEAMTKEHRTEAVV